MVTKLPVHTSMTSLAESDRGLRFRLRFSSLTLMFTLHALGIEHRFPYVTVARTAPDRDSQTTRMDSRCQNSVQPACVDSSRQDVSAQVPGTKCRSG